MQAPRAIEPIEQDQGIAAATGEADPASRPMEAVLLLCKGGYGSAPQVEPHDELRRLVAAVRATGRYQTVDEAFIDAGTPSLSTKLQAYADSGVERIIVVPAFVPMDRLMRSWLPFVIRRWLRRYKRSDVQVILSDAPGDHQTLGVAVTQVLADAEDRRDIRVDAPVDRLAGDWSTIPEQRYHVLTCNGPRCMTAGAGDLWQQLRIRLAALDLDAARGLEFTGPKAVRVVRTGCLHPCNRGPVMLVYPDEVWYCYLKELAIDRIVDEHLVGGRLVEKYARWPAAVRTEPIRAPE